MARSNHRLSINTTRDRYWIARCTCGWESDNCDNAQEASAEADDHEATEILNEQQHNLNLEKQNNG